MENVTNVEVLQINTQPSQTSVRDLRTQIKDLKDELLNLDAGTEEYNSTLLKLGDAQHQLVELNEQMRQTTSDFGDRLGNTTRLLAGMSGAVSAVTGTLSLLGVEVGDADNGLPKPELISWIEQGRELFKKWGESQESRNIICSAADLHFDPLIEGQPFSGEF